MTDFLAGATTLACTAIALRFLRYWRDTRDELFGAFSIAFGLFALNRVLLTVTSEDDERRVAFYAVRALGFLLIIAAIIHKNRRHGRAD